MQLALTPRQKVSSGRCINQNQQQQTIKCEWNVDIDVTAEFEDRVDEKNDDRFLAGIRTESKSNDN